ncbi:asparagine synthase-related protein [Paenibacillus kribbensis]|uniref:asparagine synthase-related protein n=1 Tax=Paenibacillus kribbensis TaxID=172713 RepID=UPI002DBA01FF|nr:asparagine synthase-related protein [Paenibacillus kribbensis]MEC0233142.1 asparagine synthase-related protein [Paenibacillus kribbensis]
MSAIAGIYSFGRESASAEEGGKMMQALRKYPADRVCAWCEGSIFMGCHAQHVTPESVHERLPFYDEQRNLAITADAILDNRSELFERLGVRQERRQEIADSELILLAYDKWGVEAAQYLIGDFAFVIWDAKRRRLYGARDMTGSRTLYTYQHDSGFAFSTVVAPLLTLSSLRKELHEPWLAEFLSIRSMQESVDIGTTAYKHINQLPPAHWFTMEEGKRILHQYACLNEVEPLRLKTRGEYIEAFREVFSQAVTARLRTHRAVGAALSGGLDSGAVASFAAPSLHLQQKPLYAYSYVPVQDFEDWTSPALLANEQSYIQSTARYVGNIHENYLDFEGKSPFSEIDIWLELMEAPYKYFENSFWIRGFYEKAQEHNVGVLLTGARGNFTVSWGPALDYYARQFRRMHWLQSFQGLWSYGRLTGIRMSRLIPLMLKKATSLDSRASLSRSQRSPVPSLIHPEFAKRMHVEDVPVLSGTGWMKNADQTRKEKFSNLAIANKNGVVATKLSLRYGLWERDPTGDSRVIRFCLSVPFEQYVQNGRDRALIRTAMKDHLPDDVRLNQRVRGVQPADWLHRMIPCWDTFMGELQMMCHDLRTAEYLNVEFIKTAMSKLRHPGPEQASDPNIRLLMHSLIVYRFLCGFNDSI